jgi:hypothetical protein
VADKNTRAVPPKLPSWRLLIHVADLWLVSDENEEWFKNKTVRAIWRTETVFLVVFSLFVVLIYYPMADIAERSHSILLTQICRISWIAAFAVLITKRFRGMGVLSTSSINQKETCVLSRYSGSGSRGSWGSAIYTVAFMY